ALEVALVARAGDSLDPDLARARLAVDRQRPRERVDLDPRPPRRRRHRGGALLAVAAFEVVDDDAPADRERQQGQDQGSHDLGYEESVWTLHQSAAALGHGGP